MFAKDDESLRNYKREGSVSMLKNILFKIENKCMSQ